MASEQYRVRNVDESRVELWCRACGYGIVITRPAPACPMCGAQDWDPRPLRSKS